MQVDELVRLESLERRETTVELSDLLAVAQQMGRRLANETHGAEYDLVLDLNELLHEVRAQVELIQTGTPNYWVSVQLDVMDKRD